MHIKPNAPPNMARGRGHQSNFLSSVISQVFSPELTGYLLNNMLIPYVSSPQCHLLNMIVIQWIFIITLQN